MGFFFSQLASPYAHLICLHAQHLGHTDAELFTLNDSRHETGQLTDTDIILHVVQSLTAQFAQLNLLDDAGERH